MKPQTLLRNIVLMLFGALLVSCNCDEREELEIEISYSSGDGFKYPAVFYREVIVRHNNEEVSITDSTNEYPLGIAADTSQYIFVADTMRDSITIVYRREFDFQSKKCGYTFTLHDLSIVESETSFGYADVGRHRPQIFAVNSNGSYYMYIEH